AGIRDIFGGRSQGYEGEIIKAREAALNEMAQHARELGANAVVGVKIDLETIGQMMLIHAQGTAVVIE
ncbi:MAG TPA: YbjQ family protein, partial [Erysipelothrix sp.]|nr:YbjQ family protein [Erysipelothrix sp.]